MQWIKNNWGWIITVIVVGFVLFWWSPWEYFTKSPAKSVITQQAPAVTQTAPAVLTQPAQPTPPKEPEVRMVKMKDGSGNSLIEFKTILNEGRSMTWSFTTNDNQDVGDSDASAKSSPRHMQSTSSIMTAPCEDCPDGTKLVLPAPPKNQ